MYVFIYFCFFLCLSVWLCLSVSVCLAQVKPPTALNLDDDRYVQGPRQRIQRNNVKYLGGCYNCGEFNLRESLYRYDHKVQCTTCNKYGHKTILCNQYSALGHGDDETAARRTGHQNCLKMPQLNARSLLTNLFEVKLLIIEKNIDILCVSEILLPHIPDSHCRIPGYHVSRCGNRHGDGTSQPKWWFVILLGQRIWKTSGSA